MTSPSKPEVVLFDFDLWMYDIAFAAEPRGMDAPKDFQYCMNFVDTRFEEIMSKLGCTDHRGFITGKGNFRHDIGTIKEYKGNRKQPRPFHYENIMAYLQFAYGAKVVDGMEADDALAITQTHFGDKSVIVSRDKDLRMVPGWHYGYAVGTQPEAPLEYIEPKGYLTLKSRKKLVGGGLKWFYAQLVMGDSTDNIQGVPGAGPVLAFNTVQPCETEEEMYNAVRELYKNSYPESPEIADEALVENAKLLWMVRELDEDRQPVMWEYSV